MDKFGDMDLFVRIVRTGGLASAGREIGLSPASVSARVNGMEKRYETRLLNRTTRSVSLTEIGQQFYDTSVRILADVMEVEQLLLSSRTQLTGPLHVAATSDLGQQHIAPLLSTLVKKHPGITPYLHLSDGIVTLAEFNIDIAIRYCKPPDSTLVAKRLAPNKRVLCASKSYLELNGVPSTPEDLINHKCLTMVNLTEPLTNWFFTKDNKEQSVTVKPARSTNDGALVRQWAVDGLGIALKSYIDVVEDIRAGRLVVVMESYTLDYQHNNSNSGAVLYAVYQSRKYVPDRVRTFITMLEQHFEKLIDD